MRIFVAVRHSTDARYFHGGLWSSNFYPALRALGHSLVESQTDLYPTSRFMDVPSAFTAEELAARGETTDRILQEVEAANRDQPIDLFLSYFYNSHFDPAGFDRLRTLGIPSINFYCNSIYQFANVAAVAAKADVSWHAERDARAAYLQAGANPIWVQMAADPGIYHPVGNGQRHPYACFVGQNYADRSHWVAALVKAGVPVEIYGSGWGVPARAALPVHESAIYLGRRQLRPGGVAGYVKTLRDTVARHGVIAGTGRTARRLAGRRARSRDLALIAPHARGPASFDRMLEVFSTSEVCLNLSNVWADGQPGSALIPHVRLRDFEAPMCRACYLTGHSDELAEFYALGREVDTYREPRELIDKTRYYLAHPAAAERLREAGYQRAQRDHTWQKRFQQLFATAGIGTS